MRIPDGRFGPLVLALALALLGSACDGGEAGDEAAPADTTTAAAEPAPAGEGTVTGGITPSSEPAEVVVTNAMPHAMAVDIEYASGGGVDLGIVPANGEQTFTLAAVTGDTVTLVASDEADTHSRDVTFVVTEGEPEAWTIQ